MAHRPADHLTVNQKRALRLRDLRRASGAPQAIVAEAIGISRPTLSGIENGTAAPGRQTLEALADFYQVSIDFLTALTPPGQQDTSKSVQSENIRSLLNVWSLLDERQRDALIIFVEALVHSQNGTDPI